MNPLPPETSSMLWSSPVLAAAIGAAAAVLGFVINNLFSARHHAERLRDERTKFELGLQHDREKQEEQRRQSLRRDIYLGLAEHMLGSIRTVGNWADLLQEHRDIVTRWQSAAHYSAKIHLMAQPELIEAFSTFNRAVDAAVLEVRAERNAMIRIRDEMERLRERRNDHRSRYEAAFQAIRHRSLQVQLPQEEHQRLVGIMEAELGAKRQLEAEHDAWLPKLNAKMAETYVMAVDRQNMLYRLCVPVAIAARRELREEIPMDVYSRILTAEKAAEDRDHIWNLFGLPKPGG